MKALLTLLLLVLSFTLSSSLPLSKKQLAEKSGQLRVPIKAIDFKGTEYTDVNNCALAKAFKRFKHLDDNSHLIVGPYDLSYFKEGDYGGYGFYKIENGGYGAGDFDADQILALASSDNEVVDVVILKHQ